MMDTGALEQVGQYFFLQGYFLYAAWQQPDAFVFVCVRHNHTWFLSNVQAGICLLHPCADQYKSARMCECLCTVSHKDFSHVRRCIEVLPFH